MFFLFVFLFHTQFILSICQLKLHCTFPTSLEMPLTIQPLRCIAWRMAGYGFSSFSQIFSFSASYCIFTVVALFLQLSNSSPNHISDLHSSHYCYNNYPPPLVFAWGFLARDLLNYTVFLSLIPSAFSPVMFQLVVIQLWCKTDENWPP